jgi:hypothetical protein
VCVWRSDRESPSFLLVTLPSRGETVEAVVEGHHHRDPGLDGLPRQDLGKTHQHPRLWCADHAVSLVSVQRLPWDGSASEGKARGIKGRRILDSSVSLSK